MLGNATRISVLAFVVGFALVAVAADGLAVEKDQLTRQPIFQECAIPTASDWSPTDVPAAGLKDMDSKLGARYSCGPSDCPCCYSFRDWWGCGWGGYIGIGMWLPGMTGVVGTPNEDFYLDFGVGDVFSNLGDIFSNAEFLLQGKVGLRKGKWSIEAAFSGMEFGETISFVSEDGDALSADLNARLYQFQFNLYYQAIVAPLTSNSDCSSLVIWEPYIGVRGNDVEMSGTDSRGLGVSAGKTWYDAVIGVRMSWDLRNNLMFDLEGDVGGGMSDLTWKLRLGANYKFCNHWVVSLGWLWLDTDFEDGDGDDYFRWDVQQSGPYLALAYSF